MLITTVADMHGQLHERKLMSSFIQYGTPDVVFLLGDNFDSDIETVLKICMHDSIRPMPVYGICGDEEGRNMLEKYGIADLHMKRTIFKDAIIGGFGGSFKYEENAFHLQFTDEESELCLGEFPYCDILLTHEKPQFKPEKVGQNLTDEEMKKFQSKLERLAEIYDEDLAEEIKKFHEFKSSHPDIVFDNHKGLSGIGEYIKKQTPQIVLHGHLQDSFFSEENGTRIKCCHDIETFEISVNPNEPIHNVSISKFGSGKAKTI